MLHGHRYARLESLAIRYALVRLVSPTTTGSTTSTTTALVSATSRRPAPRNVTSGERLLLPRRFRSIECLICTMRQKNNPFSFRLKRLSEYSSLVLSHYENEPLIEFETAREQYAFGNFPRATKPRADWMQGALWNRSPRPETI